MVSFLKKPCNIVLWEKHVETPTLTKRQCGCANSLLTYCSLLIIVPATKLIIDPATKLKWMRWCMQKRRFLQKHLKILPRTGGPWAQKQNCAELGYCCRTCPPLALNFFWQVAEKYKKFCSVFGGNLNRGLREFREFFICKQWVFWKVKCPQELGILFFETCNVMPLMLCTVGVFKNEMPAGVGHFVFWKETFGLSSLLDVVPFKAMFWAQKFFADCNMNQYCELVSDKQAGAVATPSTIQDKMVASQLLVPETSSLRNNTNCHMHPKTFPYKLDFHTDN